MTTMMRTIASFHAGRRSDGRFISSNIMSLIRHNDPYRDFRREVVSRFGFAILDSKTVNALRRYQPLVELAAGTGYWTYELRKAGIDCIATEPNFRLRSNDYGFKKCWTRRRHMTASQALKAFPDRTPILSWPCYNEDWAYKALKRCRANTFIYIGEGYGGCTADDSFHELLNEKWIVLKTIDIPQWEFLHDRLTVYEKKPLCKKRRLTDRTS